MDSTDDTHLRGSITEECKCHECREARGEQTVPEPVAPPVTFYASADDAPVGPNGETRAQAREELLDALTNFAEEVRTAQDKHEIDSLKAYRLRLQIHRERCALLGLGYANGVTW